MRYLILFSLSFALLSCGSNTVYQDYNDLEESFWHKDSIQSFSFDLEDASQAYVISATFRNSASYPFYNLYFQYTLLDSADQVLAQQMKEVNLFNPKTGEPLGSGLGDLFDQSFVLLESYTFPASGTYQLQLEQYMRRDTLPLILSVGAKLELAASE